LTSATLKKICLSSGSGNDFGISYWALSCAARSSPRERVLFITASEHFGFPRIPSQFAGTKRRGDILARHCGDGREALQSATHWMERVDENSMA
jgi:hypothetical protein